MYNLILASLNINGLNVRMKHLQLIDFMKYNRITVLLVQEHNIRNIDAICSELNDFCEIVINPAIAHKGGTAILIDKRISFSILNVEKSANSRIISLKISIYSKIVHLINIYAHASCKKDREELFNKDLIYYLRNNLENTIIAGDWNCVISQRDTESRNSHISKALLNLVNSLNLKDIWFKDNNVIEYTYVRENFGSRIDRIYVKNIFINHVKHVNIVHTNLSDHSCVKFALDLPNIPKQGKYFWKLNVSLLNLPDVNVKFRNRWVYLISLINRYDNINEWCEYF